MTVEDPPELRTDLSLAGVCAFTCKETSTGKTVIIDLNSNLRFITGDR